MIALNISDQHWIDEAACGSAPADEIWFDYGKHDEPMALHAARSMCGTEESPICPVFKSCLEYALANRVEGIWAATTVEERGRIRYNRARKSRAQEAS